MNVFHIISIAVATLSFGTILYLGIKTDLLHSAPTTDNADPSHRPYSISRFQLWLWSLVICPVFVLFWGFSPDLTPMLNTTALILLGIPAGVAVTSAVVSSAQETTAAKKINAASPPSLTILKHQRDSDSFWTDLITDDAGQISIVRLQHLIFTLIYVVIYISTFFAAMNDLPVFGKEVFVLMGISSGTYLIGKGVNK